MPDKIEYAGQFQIDIAEIFSSEGKRVGIEPNIIKLTLYEDIDRPWIRGECLMHNQASMQTITPLLGQEYFRLKLKTPSLPPSDSFGKNTIDYSEHVFHIYTVGKANLGTGTEAVSFSFITGEIMKNGRVLISEALEGSCSQIVFRMLERVDCRKPRWIEPSADFKKVVAPNISPFTVINMMKKQALSTSTTRNSPRFLFYENFEGFHFRSLDNLFTNERVWYYNTKPEGASFDHAQVQVMNDLETILSYNMTMNDQRNDQMSGMLSSDLIVHDITTKSFSEHRFDYFKAFHGEITSVHPSFPSPVYNQSPVDDIGTKVTWGRNKQMLQPDSTRAGLDLRSIENAQSSSYYTKSGIPAFNTFAPEKWMQRRTSAMAEMNSTIGLNMRAHGNTMITVGDLVNCTIPHHAQVMPEGSQNQPKEDKFFSGNYLIRRIKHDFTVEGFYHEMNMTLYKNGLEDELSEKKDAYEPMPEKMGPVYGPPPSFFR